MYCPGFGVYAGISIDVVIHKYYFYVKVFKLYHSLSKFSRWQIIDNIFSMSGTKASGEPLGLWLICPAMSIFD